MQYYSTRDRRNGVSAAAAIAQGLARDGGLFVPQSIPQLSLDEIRQLRGRDYREKAVAVIGRYLDEFTEAELTAFVGETYSANYDSAEIAPTRFLDADTGILELWHGPTCAFKDMALQMLPRLLTASLKKLGETRRVCILVATSGDTGKAALEGFADVEGASIVVFYPYNGVSEVQKRQMTTQRGENVLVSAVKGNFDDVQAGVKQVFGDRDFMQTLDKKGVFLSSANSINWGRLLPQIVYYFSSYCDFVSSGRIKLGDGLDFCVPTGNFGDILAGWYAKKMGLPIRRLICASNANNVLTDFINTGVYDRNRAFHTTVSPSMDILVSSNLERLLFMLSGDTAVKGWMEALKATGRYDVGAEVLAAIRADFDCGCATDGTAKAFIAELFAKTGYLMDTHTADAYAVLAEMRETGARFPAVIVSTASPYKFCDSVLDALGQNSAVPGAELIEKLAAATSTRPPKPLTGLFGKTQRFTGCVPKEKMQALVLDFLS
ncbi:MAG: threonine synthase [Oscillospiraceae bacterium]|jgi:threonine synthase|nr:threonine synthase [Oscillospiraceae bacterium]